ncbi:unnamed protein product [Closterium sp. NIES-53]
MAKGDILSSELTPVHGVVDVDELKAILHALKISDLKRAAYSASSPFLNQMPSSRSVCGNIRDVKPQQQHEQENRQRPQEATSVASAAAHLPEIPVEADVDWQETASRQVDASVEGGIDEEETAGWQAALGAEEVEALRAGVGKSVAEGRKRMGGRGEASEGEGGRKGGVGLEGEGVEGEGKPLAIEGEAGVLKGGEGGGEAGGEQWDVPLVPDMPGVLSMGDVMGGAEQMAASTWRP